MFSLFLELAKIKLLLLALLAAFPPRRFLPGGLLLPHQLKRLLCLGPNTCLGELSVHFPLHPLGIGRLFQLLVLFHSRAKSETTPVLKKIGVYFCVLRLCAEDDPRRLDPASGTALVNADPERGIKKDG